MLVKRSLPFPDHLTFVYVSNTTSTSLRLSTEKTCGYIRIDHFRSKEMFAPAGIGCVWHAPAVLTEMCRYWMVLIWKTYQLRDSIFISCAPRPTLPWLPSSEAHHRQFLREKCSTDVESLLRNHLRLLCVYDFLLPPAAMSFWVNWRNTTQHSMHAIPSFFRIFFVTLNAGTVTSSITIACGSVFPDKSGDCRTKRI